MVTPLEREVLDDLVAKLQQDSISEAIIAGLTDAFQADRLPTADEIAALIRDSSGDRTA
jgi:outer membrane protein OmpA-like peptidoglycan-associated protein